MRKIPIAFILALLFPQLAAATTYSLDDGTNGQADIYTYENFIGTTNLKVDAKPNDWFFGDANVTKNDGKGLGVDYDVLLNPDNSRALEYGEGLVFYFSEEVMLSGFTITPSNQPSHYFGLKNKDDNSGIDFAIDAETGFVSFTEGHMSLMSFVITGLENCTGLFIESFETTTSAVPLPAALPLYAAGMGVLGFMGWRKKRKNL